MSISSALTAMVPRYLRGKRKWRKARGFSLGELKEAGLKEFAARSKEIRVDKRRSTVHAQNVAALTGLSASPLQEVATPTPSVEASAAVSEPIKVPVPRKRKRKASGAKPAAKRKT